MVAGLGTSPEKKNFCLQNDKFGCILPQFLTGRKRESLRTRILQSNCKITKLTKAMENYPKIHGQTGGGGRNITAP